MRKEIRFAGFGGQGIILAANIIGKGLTLYEDKRSILTQSYGPEARGGASRADIVITEDDMDYPMSTNVDILVAMSQEAYDEYCKVLKDDGHLIIDQDLVNFENSPPKEGWKISKVPATAIAETIGRRIVANIVMLGFFTSVTDVMGYDSMKKAILATIPKGTEELNSKAYEAGYNYKEEAQSAGA